MKVEVIETLESSSRMKNPKKEDRVVIFGNAEIAQVAYVYLQKDSSHEVAGFTVHSQFIKEKQIFGLPVVPFETVQETHPPNEYKMYVAIGYRDLNKARERIYLESKRKGYELITYISSKAIQWGEIQVGDNCFIFEGNVIQPFVRIGSNVIIWSGNHIGHHASIGDHCFIASHVVISGAARIGSHCFIGVNATIRDHIAIADDCIIGAGALVMHDTKHGEIYAATPTEPRGRKEV
jgi:sugar O-acyltransferase (sialic acid O-acetyltransferase NeuD family)